MDGANRSNKKPKRKNQTPEAKFRLELELCSKRKDLNGAIALYESALAQKIQLNLYLYNALLFLCSSSVSESGFKELAVEFGFRIFDQLKGDGVVPNEATITSVARLAAAKGDGELAFSLAKEIGRLGFVPKLRSYDPALDQTMYLCGEKTVVMKETPFKMGETLNGSSDLDINLELKVMREKLQQLNEDKSTEAAIRAAMKDLGNKGVQKFGWPNAFVFTKAMGEILIGESMGSMPLAILPLSLVLLKKLSQVGFKVYEPSIAWQWHMTKAEWSASSGIQTKIINLVNKIDVEDMRAAFEAMWERSVDSSTKLSGCRHEIDDKVAETALAKLEVNGKIDNGSRVLKKSERNVVLYLDLRKIEIRVCQFLITLEDINNSFLM
uniref:Uncharacterized protein n=1 Tax=Kalanchoe fedtschenkoi TaxID=63787 RepID=A0A7N0RCN8_KALFE